MKDIARMLTATTPSLSLLTAFSQSSSVLIDATPAGWTYVGSNVAADQGSISAGAGPSLSTIISPNYCLSSPCLNSGILKYAILNQIASAMMPDLVGNMVVLTGASAASATGIVTNEGARYYCNSATYLPYDSNYGFSPVAGSTFHLIANQQHITIIQEGRGIMGIWETTNTNAHSYYNNAPFIQFSHANTATLVDSGLVAPTVSVNTGATIAGSFSATAFGTTNVGTGVLSGTISIANITSGYNVTSLATAVNNWKVSTIDAVGSPKYLMSPVYFQDGARGYPTQFITGIVPIYWVKAGLGNSGDTVSVNSVNYTYFNSGTGFGVIMTTG